MKTKSRKILILALALAAILSLFIVAGCSKDVVRLKTDDKIKVVYDPMGGMWTPGTSDEPRTFYAYENSLLPMCYEKSSTVQNGFLTIRQNDHTLVGWYRSFESETFQPDALGNYVKYAFEEAEDGTYKLDYFYTEDVDGDFVLLSGEEGGYESFDAEEEYASEDYVGTVDANGKFTATRYARYETYSVYEAVEGEEAPEHLYKQIESDDDEAFVAYQAKNPAHANLQRYEAYFTFDESQRWDFKKDRVTEEITLYARWKRSNTVLYMNGDKVYSSWVDGQKATTIKAGEKIPRTQNNPVRAGSTFVGWYTDPECTVMWDFENGVFPTDSEVLTLYAKFLEGEWTTISTKTQLENVFKINDPEGKLTAEEKQALLDEKLSGNYVLMTNIDCGGDNNPLGLTNNQVFKGTFDGNGYSITNFTINSNKNDTIYGLFRILDGATIKNLTCDYKAEMSNFTNANEIMFGAVAGAVRGEKSVIENCNFTVKVTKFKDNNKFRKGKFVGGEASLTNAYVGSPAALIETETSTSKVTYPSTDIS